MQLRKMKTQLFTVTHLTARFLYSKIINAAVLKNYSIFYRLKIFFHTYTYDNYFLDSSLYLVFKVFGSRLIYYNLPVCTMHGLYVLHYIICISWIPYNSFITIFLRPSDFLKGIFAILN